MLINIISKSLESSKTKPGQDENDANDKREERGKRCNMK